jgi:hypothetical protein
MSFQKNKCYRIRNQAELVWLANEMKMDAVKNKVTEAPIYSKDEVEANQRIPDDATAEDFLACAILWQEKVYSICLTVDAYDGNENWHLSIGSVNPTPPVDGIYIPLRADDEATKFIGEAFFGGECQEGPPEGAFKNVRHFRSSKVFRSDNRGT